MIRLEIVANKSVESDIREALIGVNASLNATRLTDVHGWGNSDPKEGNAVWPEENILYIIYADDDTAHHYIDAVRRVKRRFPLEGIKVFALPYRELLNI